MEVIILGIIQGITEFLPISSSAHLLLLPYLFGWEPSGLSFDVALHIGTLAAVLIYFFPMWRSMVVDGIFKRDPKQLRLLAYLVIATIPAAVFGYLAERYVEDMVRQPVIAAIMLILFALILWLAECTASLTRSIDSLTWKESLIIGVSQILALIPGVSRSGITMTSGLALGLKKEEAANFSFLLMAPISLGAALTQLPDIVNAPNTRLMALGALVSFVVGIITIHFLLRFVKRYGFLPYVWYRIILGVFLLILITSR